MSRDVATVIGTGVGGYFGGYQGAQIGYAVGSLVGNMYDPAQIHRQGPRLSDLKVQTSSYGNPIPICYGAMRISGNMIWSTPIIETPVTTTSSAKGGPEVVSTSYSYTQSFAIALCEGEIAGIRKIWANGTLIYNISDDADSATVTASRQIADTFRIYTGSESQTADSLIEANIGAADTPAYRGIAYVVFENMQLAKFGYRTPNLEFEVVESWSIAHPKGERTTTGFGASQQYGCAIDPITKKIWTSRYIFDPDTSIFSLISGAASYWGIAYEPLTQSMWIADSTHNALVKINTQHLAQGSYSTGGSAPRGVAYDPVNQKIWVVHQNDGKICTVDLIPGDTFGVVTLITTLTGNNPIGIAHDPKNNKMWITNYSANSVSVVSIFGDRVDIPVAGSPVGIAYDNYTESMWVGLSGSSIVNKISVATNSISASYACNIYPASIVYDEIGKSIWAASDNSGDSRITRIDIITGTISNYAIASAIGQLGLIFDESRDLIWGADGGGISSFNILDYGYVPTSPALSTIVSDIAVKGGLTAGQLDVVALTDSVHGYVVQRGSARSQLEQLMSAFFFDSVESDGKIKFVKRGGSSVISIPEDDLAAHEYGTAQSDSLVMNRQQEMELPLAVEVQYIDTGAAYSIGSQNSQRLTTESENKASLNFAIAMTATKAKQVADVLMYDAWASRTSFDFETGWEYCYLEPTDIVTVTRGARTYTVRIIEDNFSSISRRRAILEDTTAYTQTATAVALPVPSSSVSAVPLTDLMLLDIPLLRDADDGNGFYAAACGYGTGWSGAQTFKSNDGGATWTLFGAAILNDATIGVSSDVLGDFTQNIFDEHNSVTVVLINGELSSTTELNILNGANAALLGNEIIQFKIATLMATDTYKLTGLLRGRQGTEWARSTHAIGDRFVLLSTATTYPMSGTASEYDLARHYRGASIGGFLDEATTMSFTNTAVQAIPYAPVHLGGGRNAAGDLTLNWIRRTRLSGAWNNYADVPLGETSEAYVVEVYNNSAYASIVRTITGITSATTSYTAAQQTTDFGSTQATVYWKVYQVSATVGNGYEARGAT